MGGSSPVKSAVKAVGSVASSMVGAVSAGFVDYNADTGGIKVNNNLDDVSTNLLSSTLGGKMMKSLSPTAPSIPKAEDPAVQAKKAEDIANKKLADQVGERGKGLSSTVLGGSTGTDNSVLKKRKLLGE